MRTSSPASTSAIDEVLVNCRKWEKEFGWKDLPVNPTRELVVVACMDSRQPLKRMLGIKPGEAHFIRNAGALVTDDVLRSLLVSIHLKGTREIMVIAHTGCGMINLQDSEFRARLEKDFGTHAKGPGHFGGFSSLEAHVREQVGKVRSHPWFKPAVAVRGFIYDVNTGNMREVR